MQPSRGCSLATLFEEGTCQWRLPHLNSPTPKDSQNKLKLILTEAFRFWGASVPHWTTSEYKSCGFASSFRFCESNSVLWQKSKIAYSPLRQFWRRHRLKAMAFRYARFSHQLTYWQSTQFARAHYKLVVDVHWFFKISTRNWATNNCWKIKSNINWNGNNI